MSEEHRIAVADALRIVTATELAVCLGLAIAVFAIYLEANRHIRRADPTQAGNLPRYVVGIAGSYAILCAFAIAEIQGFYGTRLTWRTPIGLPAATLGLWALANLLRFERARLDLRDRKVHVEGAPPGADE